MLSQSTQLLAPAQKFAAHVVRRAARWTKLLLPPLLAIAVFRSAVADWRDVPTGSMEPTVMEGDRIVINKMAYELRVPFCGWRLASWAKPAHGDVVAFVSPEGVSVIKRVVGLPGDEIELKDNQLYINGVAAAYEAADPALGYSLGEAHALALEQSNGKTRRVMTSTAKPASCFGPVVVPEGHYFMMGDNRDNSRDSRIYGFVSQASIFGRVASVALSFDLEQRRTPRWERFCRSVE